MTEQKISQFPFEIGKAREAVNNFNEWKKDPIKYENNPNARFLMAGEYKEVKNILTGRFRDRIINSSLSTGKNIGEKDIDLIHEIQDSLKEIEEKVVPDEKRRPWNDGCIEHSRQVEIVSRVMAEEINKKNPGLNLDVDKTSAKGAFHDFGRSGSQNSIIHGFIGRELLKELGFAPEFRTTTLAHLEAGIGPYITDINKKSWEDIRKDEKSLKERVSNYSIEEVIVALADMAKKGEEIDGKFYNNISDPIEGLWPSIKRRMPDATDEEIKGTMYVGFAQALKDYIEDKFSVSFSGENGIIEKAKKLYTQEFVK